jgi:GNAT superfamily N-acetyltransferase
MSAVLKPALLIKQEPYCDALIAEAKPLLVEHWREVALYKDAIPLDPDFDLYRGMAAKNRLFCLTARVGGELVGYCAFVLMHPGHYKSTLHGINDVIYVAPAHRKGSVGYRLIRESERGLKARGVRKISWHVKPGTKLAQLLDRLGYATDEILKGRLL